MPINDILRGLIPPLLVALVVLAAAWRPWRRGSAPWGRLGSAVAIGASLAAGAVLAARGWPGMPLDNPDRWLGVIAVIGAAAAAMEPRLRVRTTRAATAVVVVALCMALLLWFELSMRSRVVEGLIRLAAYTAVGSLLVVEVRSLAQRTPGARVPLVLWVAATGQFLVMLQSGVFSSAIPAAVAVGLTPHGFDFGGGGSGDGYGYE